MIKQNSKKHLIVNFFHNKMIINKYSHIFIFEELFVKVL